MAGSLALIVLAHLLRRLNSDFGQITDWPDYRFDKGAMVIEMPFVAMKATNILASFLDCRAI